MLLGAVLLAPYFNEYTDFSQCSEPMSIHALIPSFPVEAFTFSILPRTREVINMDFVPCCFSHLFKVQMIEQPVRLLLGQSHLTHQDESHYWLVRV